MVLAVVVVVVAVIVVAVPIVVDAIHDDHPFLRDPFPRAERTDMPKRNGRPRPVARMAGDVVVVNTWRRRMVVGDTGRRRMVVGDTGRRRMVARLRTGIPMPCYGRRIWMTGGSSMLSRAWLSRAWLGCAWLGCRSRDLRRPRLLGRSCRSSVAAMVTALRRSDCRCAECRAGDPDDCEFHDVVVHGIPSLSVCGLTASSSRLTLGKENLASVSDNRF